MLGPLDNHARLQLALAYIAMKRGDWARPELERLALSEPANVTYSPGWLDWTTMPANTPWRFAGCRMLSRAPAFTRACDNLGLCYEALNQTDEAILITARRCD